MAALQHYARTAASRPRARAVVDKERRRQLQTAVPHSGFFIDDEVTCRQIQKTAALERIT